MRLPTGIINDLYRLSARKELRGLGFRDLSIFNNALLAKQWWRLIHFPNTLAAKVLKHCYFPDSSIVQVSDCSYGSFLWKSFVWGKELLDAGSRWCIADGSSVSIYHDRWLPRPISFKVQSPPVLDIFAKVGCLKLSSGAWNEDLIHASFEPDEASLILNLPCSLSPSPDAVLWYFDKLGSYTVKSGYHFGCERILKPSTSGLNLVESWWKALWPLKVPGKVKLLIWRGCHNWLPCKGVLSRQGFSGDQICSVCHSRPESPMHALWGCHSLKSIRSMCGFTKGIKCGDDTQFIDFMMECRSRLSFDNFELLCIVIWRIWYRRNDLVHNHGSLRVEEVVLWSLTFLSDFQRANSVPSDKVANMGVEKLKWKPPGKGLFKINTDAAINGSLGRVGIGIIIRDSAGHVMASSSQSLRSVLSPQSAEAVAILRGLQLARDSGL
ncbi:hypothetical protein Ddye_018445 [Dipteronia dyeriana]|uniref:Reverse transcriptase zinc-binding domain-containing protein n=1 Tax=Dipteronia dyeriana TaxID=168575 RepID=A0AAD9X1G1_9ROSI|nr:hypothetical protein Ddye_018445 [Dipteronia dyeriana]